MYICQVIFENGKRLKPVIRKTKKGYSDYANRIYSKYFRKNPEIADTLKIEIYNESLQLITTYHA